MFQFVSSPVTNAERNWKERIAQRLAFTMGHVRHGAERVSGRTSRRVRRPKTA
jgi:hypothetical protein